MRTGRFRSGSAVDRLSAHRGGSRRPRSLPKPAVRSGKRATPERPIADNRAPIFANSGTVQRASSFGARPHEMKPTHMNRPDRALAGHEKARVVVETLQ